MFMDKNNAIVQMDYLLSSGFNLYGPPILVFISALHGITSVTNECWDSDGDGRGYGRGNRLSIGDGYGDGYGDGDGYGCGYGDKRGSRYGPMYGCANFNGLGYGDGSGHGYGLDPDNLMNGIEL